MLPKQIQVFERGWLSSNNVLLSGADGAALVDSGYVTHAPQTLALLAHALGGRRLARLVNTHCHSDHMGGNRAIQDAHRLLYRERLTPKAALDRIANEVPRTPHIAALVEFVEAARRGICGPPRGALALEGEEVF